LIFFWIGPLGKLKLMKDFLLKSIYTGIGLIGNGKDSVEKLGKKLAEQADISEKEGERIARDLQKRSQRAATALHKAMDVEVSKVVGALKDAAKELAGKGDKKPASRGKRKPSA
jgi:polyhydroxyalkanoate synthesis regulator phasin